MEKIFTYLTIFYLVAACASSSPVPDENASQTPTDEYEKRIKLLTGSTNVPKCSQNNADLGECLKRLFYDIQPYIANGIPELNIPPYDPLRLNSTVFRFEIGAARGRLQMKDAAIYGLSTHELKKVDFKVENDLTKYEMETFVPKMNVVGNYKAVVTLNNQFNFKPHGSFNLTLHDVAIKMFSEGKFIEKDGHKFVRLHKIDADPKIGNMEIDVTGIFEDPELNKIALNVAKDYWREVYRIMLPETRDYWAPLIMRMLNEVLLLIPYDAFVNNE